MKSFSKMYMCEEDRFRDERDDHIHRLRDMDRAIANYVEDERRHGHDVNEMWDDLAREVRVSIERLAAVRVDYRNPNADDGIYRALRKCEENLKREANFRPHRYVRNNDLVALACILEISPLTERYAREIVESAFEGGRMIWPKSMSIYEEISVRSGLWRCISVTVGGAKGGIQNAMIKYKAVGATLTGTDFKVYFRPENDEEAVLFKCAL